jgi:hypothetical protein
MVKGKHSVAAIVHVFLVSIVHFFFGMPAQPFVMKRLKRLPGLIEDKRALMTAAMDFEEAAGAEFETATRLDTGATYAESSSLNGVLDQSESSPSGAKIAGRAATGGVAFR